MKAEKNNKEAPAKGRGTVTYGVNGMMEWYAIIPAGKSTLRVHFTGGTVTGYGTTPATFTTDNPAVMHLIENSYWFKTLKKIFIVNRV